jgi:DNA-binding LacI/PurR family transcriptional regulator
LSKIRSDQIAVHANPSLTTVRQPLQKMGEIAARTLIDQIEGREEYLPEILIEPELVVRKSTAAALSRTHSGVESNQGVQ